MSDEKIQVQITAQVQSLLDGMSKAQSSVKEATEGMSTNIAKMAETFASMGTAAVGLAAVGLAFEAIKKSIEYVDESIEKTKELAEQFRTLKYATGASNAEMNQYTAAIEMSGGSTETLTGLMQGMVRSVKANADGLVLNGMAADKAALQQLSFGDYMKKATEIADNMRTPLERAEFLTLAFGRAGARAGAMLKELQENMEKVAGTSILSPEVEATMKELTAAEGNLKRAQQERAASVAAMAAPAKIAWDNMRAAALDSLSHQDQAMQLAQKGLIEMVSHYDEASRQIIYDYQKMEEAAHKYSEEAAKNAKLGKEDMGREMMHAGGGQAYKTPETGAAAKPGKAASQQTGDGGESVSRIDEQEWEAKYLAKMKAAKVAMAREEAREETSIAKDALTLKEQMLDQDVAMGRKTIAQKLAAEKDLITQREAAELQALSKEQAEDGVSLAKWKELENRKLDVTRKAVLDRQKVENQAELDIEKKWQAGLDKMTQGWADGIQKMLHNQLSFSQGIQGAFKQMEDQFEQSVINMGLNWAKGMALQMLTSKETHASENLVTAKSAAGHAYDAVVGIPYVGPFMAPAAAAVAFAGVMAFAEGGWDRVPSDQVAMIHKNEMVLPANIAEGARRVFSAAGESDGGKGGGGDHFHFHNHAVDAKGFEAMINRSGNQSALLNMMRTSIRNGRTS